MATAALPLPALAQGARYFPTADTWQRSDAYDAHEAAFTGGDPEPKCQEFFAYSFLQQKPDIVRTDSVVVVKNGLLEFEQYGPGQTNLRKTYYGPYDHDKPHVLFSASKSVTSALVAAAIQQGIDEERQDWLTEDSRLGEDRFYPSVSYRTGAAVIRDTYEATRWNQELAADPHAEDRYNAITVKNLVEMTAGLDWNENYGDDPKTSSVMRMLYAKGFNDMALYAAIQPMTGFAPGQIWNYSSGNMSLVLGMLKKLYGDRAYASLPWDLLFDRMGFKNAVFERDGNGNFVGSSYVHLRPIDMAKFGYLYLNGGSWNGTQIVPQSWVDAAQHIVDGYRAPATHITDSTDDGVYGRTWWLNQAPGKKRFDPTTNQLTTEDLPLPYPDLPTDFYGAFGHYGQYIFVIPSRDMVIVRTAQDRDPHQFDVNHWVAAALTCFE